MGLLGNGDFLRLPAWSIATACATLTLAAPASAQQVTQVVASNDSTCAVLVDTTVKCWGLNEYGQLGLGSSTPAKTFTPTAVKGLTGVKKIARNPNSISFTCALLLDGHVKCWGDNYSWQLGVKSPNSTKSPVQVQGVSGAVDISVGGDNTGCAVLGNGTVKCWGAAALYPKNKWDNRTLAFTVPGVSGVKRVVNGFFGNCALLKTGSVRCWNTYYNRKPVTAPGINNATEIVGGTDHACVLLADGTAKCWGENLMGQLGTGSHNGSTAPVAVKGLTGVKHLSSAATGTCAILTDNTVSCWGYLPTAEQNDSYDWAPSPLAEVPTAADIAIGAQHACALATNGTVACWGDNQNGQLGNPQNSWRTTPTPVSTDERFTQLKVSGTGACGVTTISALYCWGAVITYPLPTGYGAPLAFQSFPVPAPAYGVTGIESASVRFSDSCAITLDHQLSCWSETGTPTTVSGLPPLKSFGSGSEASRQHSCVVAANGTVWCWGSNDSGQLGNGTLTSSTKPVQVTGISTATQVATGRATTCALLANRSVKCWGDSTTVAYPATAKKPPTGSVPVTVDGITNATFIALGEYGSCAIVSAGAIDCWDSFTKPKTGSNLVRTPGITGATELSMGPSHSCAVLTGGTANCWGANANGELGDGTTIDHLASVSGLTGVTHISVGYHQTCALVDDGKAYCWGSNAIGNLGLGEDFTQVKSVEGL